jgi:hypothetical protein
MTRWHASAGHSFSELLAQKKSRTWLRAVLFLVLRTVKGESQQVQGDWLMAPTVLTVIFFCQYELICWLLNACRDGVIMQLAVLSSKHIGILVWPKREPDLSPPSNVFRLNAISHKPVMTWCVI